MFPVRPFVFVFFHQSIRTSGLVLLETILVGALLLYFPVSLPPDTHCLLSLSVNPSVCALITLNL